jgi:inner membrane protein
MATFLTHPLFGAGAAYVVGQSRPGVKKFMLLSAVCQWVPDIDVLAYMFAIPEQHALGHRGLAHSLLFAGLVALCTVRYGYRELRRGSARWWALSVWFFVMTGLHGVFDGMVADSLGVAFFWPFAMTRYHLTWQPFIDVPIEAPVLWGARFWYAVFVESQLFSLLLAGVFVVMRLAEMGRRPQPEPGLAALQALSTDSQQSA